MSKYDYGWEKLYQGVRILTMEIPQRKRLVLAMSEIGRIRPDEHLPNKIVEEFNEFIAYITSVPAKGDEGTIAATVNSLDDSEISEAIDKIIGFYDKVCRHSGPI